jgi:hypothetical protein
VPPIVRFASASHRSRRAVSHTFVSGGHALFEACHDGIVGLGDVSSLEHMDLVQVSQTVMATALIRH